ncbi:hypothetical protein [Solicola sp. PLA-1-18]|uniref:hypothetical protein n=1 Tax=Solicola sp. PLA-1-18 TaxID=3380532 RepID=UPI003B7FA8D0
MTTTKKNARQVADYVGLDDMRDALMELDAEFAILPAHARAEILADVDLVITAAKNHGSHSASALRTNHRKILVDMTGLSETTDLVKFHKTDVANTLHRYRNAVVMLLIAGAHYLNTGAAPTVRAAVKLQTRTTLTARPLTDDEIALCRTWVAATLVRKPNHRPSYAYALQDAGANPAESTRVTLDDFDDDENPHEVKVLGNAHPTAPVHPRNLLLDGFGRTILQRLTSAAYRANNHETPLTFEGKSKPGSAAASASASGVADNILRTLGLKNGDVTAAAVVLWRIKTVWDLHGQDAAMSISGRTEVAHICNRIYPAGLPRIPSAVEEPVILRF